MLNVEMKIHLTWILVLILQFFSVTSQPAPYHEDIEELSSINKLHKHYDNAHKMPNHTNPYNDNEQIISVRITSSVAVGRTKGKSSQDEINKPLEPDIYAQSNPSKIDVSQTIITTDTTEIPTSTLPIPITEDFDSLTYLPQDFQEGVEEKTLRKGVRGVNQYESLHSFHVNIDPYKKNQSVTNEELLADVPLARSVPFSYSSKNYLRHSTQSPQLEQKLTTVNFNVVYNAQKESNFHGQNNYDTSHQTENSHDFYHQPSKIYSQPSQIYSEPAKFYSEPAKIYSEPAKIYSEPAKIYSEPAKVYSEPAKFYSQPASLHLSASPSINPPWKQQPGSTVLNNIVKTSPSPIGTNTQQLFHLRRSEEQQPEKNYEVDEKVSVVTNGRSHGEQPSNPENCKQDNCKVGYVVEGRQFRKYRVEERTSDGFIVGEYGVVRNEDGALRGVRYTADSEASPRLIHDALMKFLQLKK